MAQSAALDKNRRDVAKNSNGKNDRRLKNEKYMYICIEYTVTDTYADIV